jgi:peptidoglycan/xylan/chitin deacetylase (PgdA/CDA1 family)
MKPLSLHLGCLASILLLLSACAAQEPIQRKLQTGDEAPYSHNERLGLLFPPALPPVQVPQPQQQPQPPQQQQAPSSKLQLPQITPPAVTPLPELTVPPRQSASQTELPLPKPVDKKPARKASTQQRGTNKRLTLSQLAKKYPHLLMLKGSSAIKKAALTFDDAPDNQYTPQVLDILKKYGVKATFFVVGSQAYKHPNIVRRIAAEGHPIGNHSYNHPLFTKLTDDQFAAQINKTQKTVKALIGYTPYMLRPPYGEITESQLLWASDHHLRVVNWNVDSLDWKQLNEQQVVTNILSHTHSGSIILQHSGGGSNQDLSGTVSALPRIIKDLQSRGYQLVTLPDLLEISTKQH